jgi:hypothetical protein
VALWLTGVLTTVRAILLFGAQLVGGIIASALVLALTPAGTGGVDVVNTTVSDQISYQQAFVLEFLGTSFLVFSVLMLAVEKVCLYFDSLIKGRADGDCPVASCNLSGTCRHWTYSVHPASLPRSLDGLFAQPSTISRPCSRGWKLPSIPLDLLDRSTVRRYTECHVLPASQGTKLQLDRSRPGCRPRSRWLATSPHVRMQGYRYHKPKPTRWRFETLNFTYRTAE